MIDCGDFKGLAADAERYLGVPTEEVVSLLIQGSIRAYRAGVKGSDEAEVTAQFNPASWALDVIVRKKIVKAVKNVLAEIGAAEAKLIAPSKAVGDSVDVTVTDEVEEAAGIAFGLIKEGITKEIRKRLGTSANHKYSEIGQKCVVAVVAGRNGNDVLLNIGGTELRLPESEQVTGEDYSVGRELVVYVKGVVEFGYKSDIVVSRSDRELVRWAVRKYVAEIDGGLMEIKGMGRIPGKTAVVAMWSGSEDVVERCIGKDGERLAKIKNELGGVDVRFVEWYESEKDLLASALGFPIKDISFGDAKKIAKVEVVKDELKKLGNKASLYCELAEELTGWKVELVGVEASEGPKIGLQ
jgi:transcription antitermination factor NusA-like protein